MKKRRSVRLKTCKSVLTVILLASTLFHGLPVSADIGVAGATSTTSVTYNRSENHCFRGNTYLGEDFEHYDFGHDFDDYTSDSSYDNLFFYVGKRQLVFNSSASYYGYSLTFTRTTKTTLDMSDYTWKHNWIVGTATDLLNGQYVGGLVDASSFTVWVPTGNSVQAIHMAPLFLFASGEYWSDGVPFDDFYGSYNINCKYSVKYVGYKTKSDYESAMSEISTKLDNIDSSINNSAAEITDNMQAQTDTITNGYNSSSGDSMNNDFSSSVGSYSDASDNLFNTATSGLDSFGFANINAYSSVVTSLSFVQTVMASMFTAVGGESGPYGIVLSILFSVVLVSLLVGIYRYYNRH